MDAQSILEIILKAKDDASKTIENAGKTIDKAKKNIEDLSASCKIAGGILTGLGTAGALALNSWVNAAADAQTEMARADAILKSTAETANSKAMSFANLKAETQKVSEAFMKLGFDDETTANVFAKSLQVTNDVATSKLALASAADLARYKEIDLADAGQALNLAMMGNTRLLKQLGIEVEDNASKQDILAAVQKKVSGQADAYSKTYKGAMDRMKVSTDNLKESLGDRLLPYVTKFIDKVTSLVDKLNKSDPKLLDMIVKITALATAFGLIAGPILLLIGFLPQLAAGFTLLTGPLGIIIGIAAAVGAAAYLIYTNWSQIQPILQPVIDWFMRVFSQIRDEVMNFVMVNLPFFVEAWKQIVADLQIGLTFIQNIWNTVWPSIKQIFEGVWTAIKGIFQVIWGVIQVAMAVGLAVITGDWDKAWKMMKDGFADIWNGIKNIVIGVINAIGGVLEAAINLWVNSLNTIIDAVNSITGSRIGKLSHVDIGEIGKDNYDYSQAKSSPYNYSQALSQPGVASLFDMMNAKSVYYGNAYSPAPNISINAQINSQMDWNRVGSQLSFALANSRY